jgi:quinol monooxygenase YgiN
MIKHIVMWKIKQDNGPDEARQIAQKIKTDLEALRNVIPAIQHLEVGLNFARSDQAADVALYSEFENMDQLKAYAEHPAHQRVVAFVRDVVTERRVVDYEC